ncbi:MAG TPA: bifunctional lytic transglycosylase/C40 family peptidase [Chloroflexota bacterium]|nr:bifunctional lytic transglycosylase/C40 family peptidase [Chloroflexota bacterium]
MQQGLLSLALTGFGRDLLHLAAGLTLAVLLAMAFAVSSLMAVFGTAAPGEPIAEARTEEIPAAHLAVMQRAATECGLPWQVLAAVAKVESDFGRNMATSSAGAIGYGQFLPSSWAAYGRGGNPYDYRDAIPAMARYLCVHGGPRDLRRALYAYNRAEWYVNDVLAIAVRYGYLSPSAPTNQVIDLARAQIGKPYVWGGASPQTSFDCSGLVQWVYRQVGVQLPRTAQQQFDATVRVPREQLQPGDLVFFAHTYPSREPITHVGIYVGHGRMINAPTQGDVIREMPVFTGFWGAHYAGAGRVRR